MLTESTCLALIGGALGVAFAYLGVGALLAQGPPDMQALADTRPKLPVLAVSILASVVTGPGLWLSSRMAGVSKGCRAVLQEGARGTVGGDAATMRQALVSVELALSDRPACLGRIVVG